MGILFLIWLCVSAVCDAIYRKFFNWLAILGGVVALVSVCFFKENQLIGIDLANCMIGAVTAFLALIGFYSMKIMGAGDVKFAAVLGLWIGWELLIPIWALSCFLAVVHGLFSRSSLRYFFSITFSMRNGAEGDNRKFIPYVTYLCISTVLVMMFREN